MAFSTAGCCRCHPAAAAAGGVKAGAVQRGDGKRGAGENGERLER